MKLTDLFIHRPVLASVVSLMILVLGLRAIFMLPTRQYPFTENAVVTVKTVYTGADPALVAGFITTPLETSIMQANGIDYLTSSSTLGASTIQAYLILNWDTNAALTEINTKVNAVLNQLPQEAQLPVISVAVGETIDAMYIGFYSDVLEPNQVTDYIVRLVQPKLQSLLGVQLAEILGGQNIAMRAWLDPMKMAAFGVDATDVQTALARNDIIAAAGRTDGQTVVRNLVSATGLSTVPEFQNLIVKAQNGAIVRMRDISKVSLGAENYDSVVSFNDKRAVYVGIKVAPGANLLEVVSRVRDVMPEIEAELPAGLQAKIVYDSSKYVYSSIYEVFKTLGEAMLIVTLMIFIFLGSLRSVTVPVIAIPLSLIGTFFMMLVLGYSINLLTLLALVLAIGLVVDDAIIVVENAHRHIEDGMSRFKAAIVAARELANPIIATSVVLVAIYLPIGFMGGLTGALFTEFAFTLAGAVIISTIVALTLSPMMCSKVLAVHDKEVGGFSGTVDKYFGKFSQGYMSLLHHALNFLPVTIIFAIIIILSNYFLFATSRSELAPEEDQGIILAQMATAPNASLDQTILFTKQIYENFSSFPEVEQSFMLAGTNGLNSSMNGMVLKPWDERKRTAQEIQPLVQNQMHHIAGGKIAVFQPPPLPGTSGLPVQFVIGTMAPYEELNEIVTKIMDEAQNSGRFVYIDSDLKIDKVQSSVVFNRDKASLMGLTMADLGSMLAWSLSQNYVNFFNIDGRSYKVIPQMTRTDRLNADQLLDYYLTTPEGMTIPLSTVADIESKVVPETVNHFQQLNSATISAVPFPGLTLGQALDYLKSVAKPILPQGYSIDYAGPSRQFVQEGATLALTFVMAMLIIYLTLAALFESFRDPLIILISVPMSICGAMLFISLGIGGATLNIYTQVGLITLIGLISKNGILIVQFANDLQEEGKSKREAVEIACELRLRPILMTTAAMVLGVIPLVLASGAGAVSRYNIGLVISTGLSIGTLFTLFVVPAVYLLLADDLSLKKKPEFEEDDVTSGSDPTPKPI